MEQGFEAAMFLQPATNRLCCTLDEEGDAVLVAVCRWAPEGRSRLTLQLLAGKPVALGW